MKKQQKNSDMQSTRNKTDKPKWLEKVLEKGFLVDKQWLKHREFSKDDIVRCMDLGLLDEISPDLYRRPRSSEEDIMGWEFPVHSMQKLMKIPVHAGGIAALENQGIIHYLRMRGPWPVCLYSYEALPKWIFKISTDGRFNERSAGKLFDPDAPGLIQFKDEDFETDVIMSIRERAMCELMDELPKHHSFHGADMYMARASWFCPKKVQSVLEACKSCKAKRLYLFFAERKQMPWLNELDLSKIKLGKGNIKVEEDGIYDQKYKISVPNNLDALAGDLVYEGEQF